MAKTPALIDVANILTSAQGTNLNWDAIIAAFENTLSLDGSTPNAMLADLDLNSNDLLNVNSITASNITVGGNSITTMIQNIEDLSDTLRQLAVDVAGVTDEANTSFDVLSYVYNQPNGPGQMDFIKAGAIKDQDADIVTAGVQAAFVAWWEMGGAGQVFFKPGAYLLNDEALNGVTSFGKTVARHIADGEQPSNRGLTVEGIYGASYVCIDKNFVNSDPSFIDRALFRFEAAASRLPQPVVRNLVFYADLNRDNRKKCPIGIKSVRGNFSNFEGLIFRGREAGINAAGGADWSNTAMHIEYINNSNFHNIRMKAGYQPTVVDMWADKADRFNAASTTQIVTNDASNAFVNPGTEPDTIWDGLWLLVTGNAGTSADSFLVKTAATGAKTNDNTLNLDPSYPLPDGAAVDFNISFQMVTGAMTSGSNVLTLNSPVLDADDEGRVVHVNKAGDPNNSGKTFLSSYIKPGSISVDGKSCELVHSDGVTPANAVNTVSDRYVIFNPGFYMGQTTQLSASGHNNDAALVNVVSENARGGAMFFFENVLSCTVVSGKAHGVSMNSPILGSRQFSEVGYLVVADNCKNLPLENILLTHAQACPIDSDHANAVLICGERSHVSFNNYELYGSPDKSRFFALQGLSVSCNLYIGQGLNNIVDFNSPSNDMGLFDFVGGTSGAWNIHSNGVMENRTGGTSKGVLDDMSIYRERLPQPEEVTISAGEVDIKGSFVILDTEAAAATDDLQTINGGFDGCVITLKTNSSSRDVVIKNNVGNIQTFDNTDLTLGMSRQTVKLVKLSGVWVQMG